MMKRALSGLVSNLILFFLKMLLVAGAVLLLLVQKGASLVRHPGRFHRKFYLPVRRPSRLWVYAGAAVAILLLPLALVPVNQSAPGPIYFASNLLIPEESMAYVGNDSLFRETLVGMGHRLNIDPSWILAVMFHESRLNPAALNHRGSGATGLIQFMGPALKDINQRLGTRYYLSDLRRMDAVSQLRLVEAYYEMVQERYGPIRNFTDAYLAVLFPRSVGKSPGHVLFSRPSRRYLQNSGLDMDKDGRVTVGDISTRLFRMFPDLSDQGMVHGTS